ncbi:hypothetical protein B0A49_10568 [Cryomyces minteri]|uniref:Fanconi-associated nuclease n=1 Tax=Cryomyces minteri TaxID=331657 RepID=A0A4U0WQE2_9PEZI|nr:hypothetical protein B0A49_10568 [Cryomyces minteri]
MRGRLIQHPKSTNFDGDKLEQRPLKRLKKTEDEDELLGRLAFDTEVPPSSPNITARNVPNSDAESDNDDLQPTTERQTDLEFALPPVKSDREAIEEYEAFRAAEEVVDGGIVGRLGQRKWIKGKSSIYVDAFNLALETVLGEEGHLFDEAEMTLFGCWRALSYEAQYLYVRLFLRKTSAWHRINRLGYHGDIADLETAITDLQESRLLPESTAEQQDNPGELAPPEGPTLGSSFTFADRSEEHITTLEEASSLLLLDELKGLAKEAKVTGKNKTELLKALRRASGKQTGLGWASLKRSDTADTTASTGSIMEDESRDSSPHRENRDAHFVRKIMSDTTGSCIRLSVAPLKLFERVHLVFYRSTEWTEKSLTTIILARISRRNFPEYIVSRSADIFSSRSSLLEFEAAVRTQYRIDTILEFNGNPNRDGLQQVLDIFEEVQPRWRVLLREEQRKEDSIYEIGEGAYLRRLSPAWVYTRIMHKGAYVLGKLRHHAEEHAILTELLQQRLFHASRRGSWYQRKALLEEHYKATLEPKEGRSDEAQKKHWKRIALRTCENGLQDQEVHLIYHYDLQKRILKLEKQLKVPKRLQHDFSHVKLAKPVERVVYGTQVVRGPDTPDNGRRSSSAQGRRNSSPHPLRGRSTKTTWLDPASSPPNQECSVEAMCLSYYRALGYKGFHAEGGILRTLFAYLFYDVLFAYLPNVFQTPYQTCPLDLHTDAFYPSRLSEINTRCAEIANGEAGAIVRRVWEEQAERRTCVVGLDWAFDVEDLLEIVQAWEGEALATVCKVLAQEYGQRGGGVPDLFLWRPPSTTALPVFPATTPATLDTGSTGIPAATDPAGAQLPGNAPKAEVPTPSESRQRSEARVLFAEVKSENDRLSDTQRLWLSVLGGAGIAVELCRAEASEVVVR